MPVNPFQVQQRSRRFADQRWLIDAVIGLVGPEWDQGRLEYLSAPCSPDVRGAILGLRHSTRKLDDFSREMTKVARHLELRGRAHIDAGHDHSAADDLFAAAVLYGGAQWPIYANTELNLALERKKTDCYLAYAERADHHVEAVEIPYGAASLPAYLHLPPGRAGQTVPCVVMVSGMDAFKEVCVTASRDRYLVRGLAVLCLDGPGQGTSLTREIWYEPDRYAEVGAAAYSAAAQRPEIDAGRAMVWGLSQGSFWATQMAAAEPRFAASSVMFTCFDPGNAAMFSMQSPTFAERFMYMTGTTSESALHAVAERMSADGLGAKMSMPSLIIAAEDDPRTDPAQTFAHFDAIAGPKELLFYVGEDHAPVTRPSGQLGPVVYNYPADLAGRPGSRPPPAIAADHHRRARTIPPRAVVPRPLLLLRAPSTSQPSSRTGRRPEHINGERSQGSRLAARPGESGGFLISALTAAESNTKGQVPAPSRKRARISQPCWRHAQPRHLVIETAGAVMTDPDRRAHGHPAARPRAAHRVHGGLRGHGRPRQVHARRPGHP